MASDETARLRRELAKHERGRGKRYPEELKRQIVEHASARRELGALYEETAKELGLRLETLRQWCRPRAASPTRASLLVPVEVVAEVQRGGISIVSPSGFRLEGLEPAEAVAALRALG